MAFNMKSIIQKAVTKSKVEATQTPTLTALLQPKTSRNFSREVEHWLSDHDILYFLENLVSHLLRTLPSDDIDEMSKFIDALKLSKQTSRQSVVLRSDIASLAVVDRVSDNETVEEGVWMRQSVRVHTIVRVPTGLKGTALKAHQYRVACVAQSSPHLPALKHENVLPTFGFLTDERSVGLLHPAVKTSLPSYLQGAAERTSTNIASVAVAPGGLMLTRDLLMIARDVANGLLYLHTLGFLHRSLTVHDVWMVGDGPTARNPTGTWALGGFSYLVRSSRGRVIAPAWVPLCAAPETMHTREFVPATDVFAFGVLLLDLFRYARGDTTHPPSERPPQIPAQLWRSLIEPCLALGLDARPTTHEVVATINDLLEDPVLCCMAVPKAQAASSADDGRIDDVELLSALSAVGASPDAGSGPTVTIRNLRPGAWEPFVMPALRRNEALRDLRLIDCSDVLDAVCARSPQPPPVAPLDATTLLAATMLGASTSFNDSVTFANFASNSTFGLKPNHRSLLAASSASVAPTLAQLNPSATLTAFTLSRTVDLASNEEPDTPAIQLVAWLRPCVLLPPLQRLSLRGVLLGDAIAGELFRVISTACRGLRDLDMHGTGVTGASVKALAQQQLDPAVRWASLEGLAVGGNAVGYSAVAALCTWIQRDDHLSLLDLSFARDVDYFAVATLGQLVRQNRSLRTLRLEGIPLSSPGLRLLVQARRLQEEQNRCGHTCTVHIDAALDDPYAKQLREFK